MATARTTQAVGAPPLRLHIEGPDGELHWYVSTQEAAERVGKVRRRIQDAANLYWSRIQAAQAAGGPVDYTPTPQELACIKIGAGGRVLTWIREDTIPLHFVNRLDESGKPLSRKGGKVAGTQAPRPYHYKPKSQDRRYKRTRQRLATQAAAAQTQQAG